MADLASPISVSPALLTPVQTPAPASKLATPGAPAAASDEQRAKAKDAADKFEGQFLSMMLQQMFQGVSTDGPFGGGFGEEMFRSLMTDAMAKNMTKAGGVGLSDTIQREILKMQGLT
jgi:Rod binding domain-containing protein